MSDYNDLQRKLEPESYCMSSGQPAFMASAAISLKRIADHLDQAPTHEDTIEAASVIGSFLIFSENVEGQAGEPLGLKVINDLAQSGFKVIRK